ncbi:MAG: adenylate cyclase, partial [Solirubrobacteraceae bacterium]|nr:adenylate cyclase [Solirubrobacteraceae bacterium]
MESATATAAPRVLPERGGGSRALLIGSWALAATLPLIGFVSLLLKSKLDPNWTNHQVHFTLFLAVGAGLLVLAYTAGEAADRRGDARVLLISLMFLSTGAFLGLHAIGTPTVLFAGEHAGFKVAIPVGLVIAALFGAASAFVDLRPHYAALAVQHRAALRRAVLGLALVWFAWTLSELPPLSHPTAEGGSHSLVAGLAAVGTVVYAIAAARYLLVYRGRLDLLPASVVACFVLLAEAMIGVAITGERDWHASWWEWHALVVLAYLVVGYAARREWRDERFRQLYLATTRERSQSVSVLFSDLAGFTTFAERSSPSEVATVLNTYYAIAAPLISRRFGGELEKFMGDGMMATFNSRGDQPDHAIRAAGAALALQEAITALADDNPGWPRLRVGVNSGEAMVREMGGHGFVAYAVIGDTVNTGSRLEGQAPVGGVLIGPETRRLL